MLSNRGVTVGSACKEALRPLPNLDENLAEVTGRDVRGHTAELPHNVERHRRLTFQAARNLWDEAPASRLDLGRGPHSPGIANDFRIPSYAGDVKDR
jgi:hypothetical protein